jgi:phosphatidylglycerol---prolipoprotein diacylglyceryl transferase
MFRFVKDLMSDDPILDVHDEHLDCEHDHHLNRGLDALVRAAHAVSAAIRYPHPYLMFMDLATLTAFLLAVLVCVRFADVSVARAVAFWGLTVVGHEVFQLVKARVTGERSRHYIRDMTAWWLPSALLFGFALGVPWRLVLDSLGVFLASWIAIVRVGCFVGGCCFGRPCRCVGVLYRRPQLFASHRPLRSFRPGPFLARRVFPLQLLSGGVAASLTAVLWFRLEQGTGVAGASFFLYMIFYAPFRFCAEYARGDRARSGVLTRTQRLLLVYFVVSAAVMATGVL